VSVLFCVATLPIGKEACLATVSTDELIVINYMIVQSTVLCFCSEFCFMTFLYFQKICQPDLKFSWCCFMSFSLIFIYVPVVP